MNRLASRFLRAAALVVTDRRWAAPLSAMALGFGLFIGVAIGPNAAGTLAGVSPVVEIPSFRGGTSEGGNGGGGGSSAAPSAPSEGGSGEEGGALGALPSSIPLVPAPSEATPPEEPSPAPSKSREEAPETEETIALKGVVVDANPAAGSYALAIKGGELVSVHAAKLPAPGSKLSLTARRLANDTFAEAQPSKAEGKAKRASFRGAITFADPNPTAPTYTVSGRGASIQVHVRPDPAGVLPTLPAPGSYATVTVEIEPKPASAPSESPAPVPASTEAPPAVPAAIPPPPPCAADPTLPALKAIAPAALLWESGIEVEGEPSTYVDLAGIVTAICASEGKLSISADGIRATGSDVLLTVPAGIDTGKLTIGDSVLATATIEADGSLTLAGLVSDERTKGADDPGTAQGDLRR